MEGYEMVRCIELGDITCCRSIQTLLEINVHGEEDPIYLTDMEVRGGPMGAEVKGVSAPWMAQMIERSIPVPT
jgi:hypothetical protein